MPQKNKVKNAPNQHDKRHENGLAPPGKRIVRQRSNGQLVGQPNGKAAPIVSPPPLPSTGLNQGIKFPRQPSDTLTSCVPASDSTSPGPVEEHVTVAERRERDRTSSDASVDDLGHNVDMANTVQEQISSMSTAGDASHAAAAKNMYHAPHTQTGGSFNTVSTILAYYPLRDAISILILLLSLPPTLVLIVQTLFASLTFVPPTAGLSLSALPNVKEMFNSSNFGYPALATILFVDLFFWVCWLPLWKPLQAIFLDLSQAVIAVSLGGAAASTGGSTYSIATCGLIVCVVHVLRYKAIHLTALDYLRSVLHKMDLGATFDVPTFAAQYHSATTLERGMAFTAVRTILGIHIISQGVTTCVRRTLANAKANERDSNVPAIVKTDTEATAGAETPSRLSTGHEDGSPHLQSGSGTEGRLPGQSPSHRENKTRESTSKKKRKQANQVRSQQPLWAAIASTKVTFVKEMEQRDAADDVLGASLITNNTVNSFSGTTNSVADRIWIYEVRDTEIFFALELSTSTVAESADMESDSSAATATIDKTKPFFVRINGAAWSSTRIFSSEEEGSSTENRYLGEIIGLAPLSSYHCEIVSVTHQRVLCSVGLITQPAPTAEQTAAPSPSQHQTLRPSSPITTLKQSIQSAETKLNETKNRTKKTKKDQRAAHADIRKEIASLKGKLESTVDDKQERRIIQISQHKNQAEEATTELKTQIEALGDLPEDEVTAAHATRRAWQAALDAKEAAEREYKHVTAEQARETEALDADLAASRARKEKLEARNAQRAQELEKLVAKQQADKTAKQKRDLERSQMLQERESKQAQFQYHLAQMEQESQLYQQKARETWQQVSALSNWSTQPVRGLQGHTGSTPPTPEGALSGSNGQISPHSNGLSANVLGPHSFKPSLNAAVAPNNATSVNALGGPRGRSSSMLSQYSGFTDNGEDFAFAGEPIQEHRWSVHSGTGKGAGVNEERMTADVGDTASRCGSGSGSFPNEGTNGSNSPRPDAKVFVPGKSVGTIGPPGRKTPQSPIPHNAGIIGDGR